MISRRFRACRSSSDAAHRRACRFDRQPYRRPSKQLLGSSVLLTAILLARARRARGSLQSATHLRGVWPSCRRHQSTGAACARSPSGPFPWPACRAFSIVGLAAVPWQRAYRLATRIANPQSQKLSQIKQGAMSDRGVKFIADLTGHVTTLRNRRFATSPISIGYLACGTTTVIGRTRSSRRSVRSQLTDCWAAILGGCS